MAQRRDRWGRCFAITCFSVSNAGTIIDCISSASQGGVTAASPFPIGMRNAASYASSSSTNFAEYEDLPGHHLLSIRSLIASCPNDSYPETASSIADDVNFLMDNFTAEEAEDYSGVRDPGAFRSFQLATAYCLTCSEDSSEGDYDPARECFMVQLADGQDNNAPGDDGNGGADAQANQLVVPPAAPSLSSSAARQALLAQLKELQAKLDEQRRQTQELRTALEQQRTARGAHAQAAGHASRERILADDHVDKPPELKTAGEKLVAAAYLLQAMPEPSMASGRYQRREAQALIEQAAVQQAESSASRMRSKAPKQPGGTARQDHEALVLTLQGGKGKAAVAHDAKAPSLHDRIERAPARERLHDTRGHAGDGDARYVINDRKYTPRRGGRFDPEHDRGKSPEPPGTRVLCREIRTASFPPRFRQPTTLVKYSGETDPAVWLNDYRLASQLGGATEDAVIIRNHPLHLADATRTWLEHFPADQIHNWADLVHIFVGNFQGTYVRPGNSWDLKGCRQKPNESLREYVRHFSKQCTELPSVTHVEVINAFLEGTTCRNLVHELARSHPANTNELFDAATNYATGEEAVGAIFDDKPNKRKENTPAEGSNAKTNALAKKQKRGRKGKKQAPPI